MAGGHPATSSESPPLPSFAQMSAKLPITQPCKSFVDVTTRSQRAAPVVAFRQSSTHRGEPAIFFTEEYQYRQHLQSTYNINIASILTLNPKPKPLNPKP
ncbi:hypothetical protein AB3S75_036393 [Citrus x aurantiifolia]